jgi:phospholipid transport system substrate-binding protein
MSESEIYNLLDKELGKVFAFRRMAGRVMGRYARSATKNERDLFVDNFKSKLFDTYVDNLRKSEGVTAVVKDARLLTNDENRGVVSLSVSDSSKESFNVSYSVFKSEDQWMVENLIIEGVNMGLAFRDSFYQEMEKNRNNIKKSIKDWGVKSDLINN